MRDTIDFGIDLGTTNSAIAVADNGTVEVIKTDEGWDYTPSAVWLRKPGTVHVGRRAREASEKYPEDVAFEFKQHMGLADAQRWFDRAGVSMSPPELSAEVLKSLRANVARRFDSDPPEAAVITVPAAFSLNQNNATNDAARLAGFTSPCPLLQEPTAAAFAYGSQDATERAYWMVFDLGGGTFDAAVMSKRDGEMQVLNHAGDPHLGGKLIDWAIVDRLLAPAVSRDLGFADFRRDNKDNSAWQVNFVRLKLAAEDAKIQLSSRDTAEIDLTLNDGQGGEEDFVYTLTRAELDPLAEPLYELAIDCCREALRQGGLEPDDIDRLLLVGGATQAPALRQLLADPRRGLGIALDFSQDPTTVVARGAALYARTVRLERPVAAPRSGEFTAELIYDPTVITTRPTVAGRLHSADPVVWSGYSVSIRSGGLDAFDSGKLELSDDGTFATEVFVPERSTVRFTVELADSAGRRQKLTPDTLTITHSDTEFGGARLTESLGVGAEGNSFVPMLRKGTPLPARHRQTFATSAALRRDNAESMLRIPIVEGARPRTNRNLQVGELEIRPRDVRMDLPAGTDVEVTFEIDSSRLVTVTADVPLVGMQVDAEIDLNSRQTPDQEELTRELQALEARAARLRAEAADEPDAQHRLVTLDLRDVEDKVRMSGVDRADAVAAEQKLRDHQATLDDVEDAVRLPSVLRDLEGVLDECAQEVERSGRREDQQGYAELRRRADEVARSRDVAAAEKQLRRTVAFHVELLRRRPDWPVIWFDVLRHHRDEMHPLTEADRLIREGERAIATGDYRELSAICERMRRLVPPDMPDPVIYLGSPGR